MVSGQRQALPLGSKIRAGPFQSQLGKDKGEGVHPQDQNRDKAPGLQSVCRVREAGLQQLLLSLRGSPGPESNSTAQRLSPESHAETLAKSQG